MNQEACQVANTYITVPAHEKENQSHNTENTDDNSQASEHCCSTESRGKNCSKIIQAAATDFLPILAITKYNFLNI